MALEGCYTRIKYLMFAYNILFWLLGCATLGVGIRVRVDPDFSKYMSHADAEMLYPAAYVLMGIGSAILIIGFLGCCGAIRESQCMLALFFVFLLIIFGLLLAVGIWAFVDQTSLKAQVEKSMEKLVETYDTNEASKELMNIIQTHFHCCGYKWGQVDYVGMSGNCEFTAITTSCTTAVFEELSSDVFKVVAVCIGVGLILLLGMIFSMLLCCAVRRGVRRTTYVERYS